MPTLAACTAFVPMLALSVGWTMHLVHDPCTDRESALPPDLPAMAEAVEQPASYAAPRAVSRAVTRGAAGQAVRTASVNGIPAAALAAYQRAETVLDGADKACNIPWQLIAAIGRVESDHGRYGGNTLGTDGVSRPGIYGIALDGTNNTAEITDTDAGQLDNDTVHDRAVGPMQFIPSTWSVVGVDADGDSKRNPQDIDDAALASAVHLCSGPSGQPGGNLSQTAGQRQAVFRYNHSEEYVDLVLSIMNAYLQGDYTPVPNQVASAVTFTLGFGDTRPTKATAAAAAPTSGAVAAAPTRPPAEPEPIPTVPAPSAPVGQPVGAAIEQATDTLLDPVLTLVQATVECTSRGLTPLLSGRRWAACIHELTH
jgi:hypothetical protein